MPTPTAAPLIAAMLRLAAIVDRLDEPAARRPRPRALKHRRALADIERIRAAGDIRTGTEPAPRAGNDDHADVVVGVGLLERVLDLRSHQRGVGVELVRPVQRDGQDRSVGRGRDVFVGHAALPDSNAKR